MSVGLLDVKTVPAEFLHALAAAGTLYAILDACDAPSVPPRMTAMGEDLAVSLYRGLAEEEYSAFAPYLAAIDEELLEWILAMPAREPWGIFVRSAEPLDALRLHFRHFLIVRDPQGEPMYFRFYDPRVLRKFLPTCTVEELSAFYGTISAFLAPNCEEDRQIIEMARAPHLPSPTRVLHPIGQRFAIRPPQMEAFGAEAEAAFAQRVMGHLRDNHADLVRGFSDAMLLPMVQIGLARARSYGLTWEANLMAYVGLMFEIAPNFDAHPQIQSVLNNPRLLPEEKLDVLMQRTSGQTWSEAEDGYDAGAWSSAPEGSFHV